MAKEIKKHRPRRYLGLELAGAKNPKTTVAALEYYPREKKLFLFDIVESIGPEGHRSGDSVLLELLTQIQFEVVKLGVNVPLQFPPCLDCNRSHCLSKKGCTLAAVHWMEDFVSKAKKKNPRAEEGTFPNIKEVTPYTQRPIELWIRYHVFPNLDADLWFDIDETLGATKAPLTARMGYLKKFLKGFELIETLPKLSVAILAQKAKLPLSVISNYRKIDEGALARGRILDAFADRLGVFIYEKDRQVLMKSLSSFDAFISAYTALLSDLDLCEPLPSGFPKATGWIYYPNL